MFPTKQYSILWESTKAIKVGGFCGLFDQYGKDVAIKKFSEWLSKLLEENGRWERAQILVDALKL